MSANSICGLLLHIYTANIVALSKMPCPAGQYLEDIFLVCRPCSDHCNDAPYSKPNCKKACPEVYEKLYGEKRMASYTVPMTSGSNVIPYTESTGSDYWKYVALLPILCAMIFIIVIIVKRKDIKAWMSRREGRYLNPAENNELNIRPNDDHSDVTCVSVQPECDPEIHCYPVLDSEPLRLPVQESTAEPHLATDRGSPPTGELRSGSRSNPANQNNVLFEASLPDSMDQLEYSPASSYEDISPQVNTDSDQDNELGIRLVDDSR